MAGPIQALEQRRVDTVRNAENSSREAMSYKLFSTQGWGEVKSAEAFSFDVVFTDRPAALYGSYVIGGDAAIVSGRFPRCSGFVYQWVQDTQGHYTGAFVAATVDNVASYTATAAVTATDAGPGYVVEHYFLFVGAAYKALPGLGDI